MDRRATETDRRFWEIVGPLELRTPAVRGPHGHGPTVRCPRCGSFMALMHMGNNEAHSCAR